MIVTILLVIVNVITRKLFNYIIIWSEEIATSCFVYSVFIGAAYAYRKHQHVGVDLLVERLPAGARRVSEPDAAETEKTEPIKEAAPPEHLLRGRFACSRRPHGPFARVRARRHEKIPPATA